MNFLAHANLSGSNEQILLGNFIADHVKGKKYTSYPDDIQTGILLHRKIDAFTDQHENVRELTQKLRPHFRKYSGIVVDIYFDHFLARKFSSYSESTLLAFSKKVYGILSNYFHLLPERSKKLIPWIAGQNWLANYQYFPDLERVFYGMDRRSEFKSGMQNAVVVLQAEYSLVERLFDDYYPQLQEYALNQRRVLKAEKDDL